MKKPLRYGLVIVCLLGISLGSAFVGAKFGFELAKKKFRQRSNPTSWNVQAMTAMEDRLELAEDQHRKIKSLMDEAVEKLKKTRQTTLVESSLVVDDLFSAVDAELTPQQQVVFRELTRDRARVKHKILQEKGDLKKVKQVKADAGPAVNAKVKEND
jgi:vacuolar-type H+-ATPase subunit E/Vma4